MPRVGPEVHFVRDDREDLGSFFKHHLMRFGKPVDQRFALSGFSGGKTPGDRDGTPDHVEELYHPVFVMALAERDGRGVG